MVTAGEGLDLWEFPNFRSLRSLVGHKDDIYAVTFTPDGRTLASGSKDNTAKIWNVDNGKVIYSLPGFDEQYVCLNPGVFTVAFSPDGRTLASGDCRTVAFWDVSTGKIIRRLRGDDPVWQVGYSPDGSLFAAIRSRKLTMWKVESGQLVKINNELSASEFSFSPDGTTLAVVTDYNINLWKLSLMIRPH
jgi:WD40 repeat protein